MTKENTGFEKAENITIDFTGCSCIGCPNSIEGKCHKGKEMAPHHEHSSNNEGTSATLDTTL